MNKRLVGLIGALLAVIGAGSLAGCSGQSSAEEVKDRLKQGAKDPNGSEERPAGDVQGSKSTANGK